MRIRFSALYLQPVMDSLHIHDEQGQFRFPVYCFELCLYYWWRDSHCTVFRHNFPGSIIHVIHEICHFKYLIGLLLTSHLSAISVAHRLFMTFTSLTSYCLLYSQPRNCGIPVVVSLSACQQNTGWRPLVPVISQLCWVQAADAFPSNGSCRTRER